MHLFLRGGGTRVTLLFMVITLLDKSVVTVYIMCMCYVKCIMCIFTISESESEKTVYCQEVKRNNMECILTPRRSTLDRLTGTDRTGHYRTSCAKINK